MGSLLTSRENAGKPRARIWKAGRVGDCVRLGGEQSPEGHMTGSGGDPGHDGIRPSEADGGGEAVRVGWRCKGSLGALGALWPWTQS